MFHLLCGTLLAPASASAQSKPSAVLLGAVDDAPVQRVANELRAGGYDVEVVSGSSATTEAELDALARARGARAAIRIEGAPSRQVVVFIAGSADKESTLRRITPRVRPGEDTDGVLALRVVEIVNAALQELDREIRGQPRPLVAPAPAPPEPVALQPRPRLSLGGGVRALWLPNVLPVLVGPELGGRARAAWGLYGEVTAFVSASSARFARDSGTTTVRAFSVGLELGYAGALSRRIDWGLGLAGAWFSPWAYATPAAGYRTRESFARSALLHAGGELAVRLSPSTRLAAALDAGTLLPRLELSMAGTPIGHARWLGAASLSLAMELSP